MAISDSLTVPLPPRRLQLGAQNEKQIEPQNSHEMPIHRGRFERTLSKSDAARDNSPHHQSKCGDSCEHMQPVHRGQHVVERAVGIRREVEALRGQLPLCEAPPAPESTLATLAAGAVESPKAGGGVRTGW